MKADAKSGIDQKPEKQKKEDDENYTEYICMKELSERNVRWENERLFR